MFVSRPQQPQVAAVIADKFPLGEYLHNFAAGKRLARGKERQTANPQMMLHRVQPHAGMVGSIAPTRLHGFHVIAATKLPARIGGCFTKADTAVFAQGLRIVGHAVTT